MEGKTRNEQHLINESCSSVKMCGKKHGNVIKTTINKITQITNINNITIFIGSLNHSQIGGGFLYTSTLVFHSWDSRDAQPVEFADGALCLVCNTYVIFMIINDP